jgi:hypothetical protein
MLESFTPNVGVPQELRFLILSLYFLFLSFFFFMYPTFMSLSAPLDVGLVKPRPP